MPTNPNPVLEVYQTGPTIVMGFGGRDVQSDVNIAVCREELLQLIEIHRSEVVAFDLSGVTLVPSGLLGLLASLRGSGAKIHLYNPSNDVREVLAITRLDKVMEVRYLESPDTRIG